MKYITLNNNTKMPLVGLGTYQLQGEKGIEIIKNALNIGYTLIDTAQMYSNEKEVGIAIKECKKDRKELFITTKICHPNTTFKSAEKAIDLSLKNLQTDYIDLLLIHEPYETSAEMYKAFEKSYYNGKVKAIGISNFNETEYKDFIKNCNIIPAVKQVECHIFYNKKVLQNTMQKYGTFLQGYSPFTQGKGSVLSDNDLMNIGEKHHKKPSQIVLKYLTERNIPVIPKASTTSKLKENIDIFDFDLDKEDIKLIESKNQDKSFFGWD